MIGIYKITKKENGKSYIGQSNDIQRRFGEHKTVGKKSRIPVDAAIEKYGAIKGSFLALWRILRCNPFSKGGYDPVK